MHRSGARKSPQTGLFARGAGRAVVVCILLPHPFMMTSIRAHTTTGSGGVLRQALGTCSWCHVGCAFLVAAVVFASTPLIAQETWTAAPHVRPEPGIRSLVEEAARRSPLIRELIDRLEGLNVTVYIRTHVFATTGLDGHIALLSGGGSARYLIIELACERNGLTQMATLGHELYHAIEIAEQPSVVSPATLADLYQRIGQQTGDEHGLRTFETDAAADAGRRARRELLSFGTRNAHGT